MQRMYIEKRCELVTTHVMGAIPLTAKNTAFAIRFTALGVVTISATLASLAQGGGVFLTLATLAAGSCLTAAGF